jgi:hypothetical protein
VGEPLDRLKRADPSVSEVIDRLDRLSGPDLTTVLLEVFRRRTASVTELPARHLQSRFTKPAPVAYEKIRQAEDAALSVLPDGVELVQLAPAAPLGAHVALGGSSQDRLVTTIRRTEMTADPTLGLALEIANRRRVHRGDMTLATLQRVSRAQGFEGEHSYGHFTLFGMVTAGRDRGSADFERWAAVEHLTLMVEAVTRAGGDRLEVSVIDPAPDQPILKAVNDAMAPDIEVHGTSKQLGDYYVTARFGVTADVGGERLDVGDGGFTTWTARMLSDRKERLCISGLGIDRLAVLIEGDDRP